MDYQSANQKTLPTISLSTAEQQLDEVAPLHYFAWAETFPNTAGPFPGIAGQAFSTFTMEAWVGEAKALLFCNGKVVRMLPRATWDARFTTPSFRL